MRVTKSPESRNRAYTVPKPTVDALLAAKEQSNRVGADFLKVDLETALTFVQVALTTEDLATRERNRKSARGAYDTVLKFTKKLHLSESDVTELKRDLRRLKADLLRLGETF
jgi:hypothetical protein